MEATDDQLQGFAEKVADLIVKVQEDHGVSWRGVVLTAQTADGNWVTITPCEPNLEWIALAGSQLKEIERRLKGTDHGRKKQESAEAHSAPQSL